MSGNTILITGGGTGIGKGLAAGLHAQGNTVIIAGRRQAKLDETASALPGLKTLVLDVADAADIAKVVAQVVKDYPALNVLINNAGIMQFEDVQANPTDLKTAEDTIATNLLGTIRLTAALLPHLLKQPTATVMTVTSGLAFVPRASAITYCATKAAIHSWSDSLRHQLRETAVEVIELIPPYTQTELTPNNLADPRAMPLQEYLDETLRLLEENPQGPEIVVERVKAQRYAARDGKEVEVAARINGM